MDQIPAYNFIAQLIIKHLKQTITAEENNTLQQWVAEDDTHRALFNQLTNDTTLQNKLIAFSGSDTRIQEQVYEQLPELRNAKPISAKRLWLRVMAAAAAVAAIVFTGYNFFGWAPNHKPATVTQIPQPPAENIPPGGNRATLILSDGSVIDLDKAGNGVVTEQGSSKVIKSKDGELKYEVGNKKYEVVYNTVSTPRGGQYQVVLGDGSKVWLNAASSIKYPTAFTGNERKVIVTGECYMEVAPAYVRTSAGKERKPFIVSILPIMGGTEGGVVEVLGTHFNVNAYGDEQPIVTTLLEGKVKIGNGQSDKQQSTIILPGEEAQINKTHDINIRRHVDTDAAVAWMKGFFDFHNADIKNVMKQVSRWYNVDVQYAGDIPPQTFEGNIDRNIPLNDLLGLLQQIGKLKFKVEGRTIKIM